MNTQLTVITMKDAKKYTCIKEKQVQKHETDITELQVKANFKEEQIKELKTDIEKMDKKIDVLIESFNNFKDESHKDDFNIDNRVTKLENTQNVLKWVVGISLTVISTLIAVMGFLLLHIH